MIQAAKEFPEVQFCHSTGTKAHTENLDNYHNAFASIYEGRYLAGVAAGLKLNEMIEAGDIKAEEAKIGYIGACTYAEVMSGYTSWTSLGVRSSALPLPWKYLPPLPGMMRLLIQKAQRLSSNPAAAF